MTGIDKSARKRELGRKGEDLAAEYLVGLGWRLLARNWRCSAGELDIVASDGATLVFCEVKTRSALGYGSPLEAVTQAKQTKLRELAGHWLSGVRHDGPIRIDVIGILLRPGYRTEVSHVRGVGQ